MKIEKCLEEFYDYLEVEKNSSSETIRSYSNDFNGFIEFLKTQGVEEDVDAIDVTDIRRYIVYMKKEKNYASESIRRKINSLKSFYKFLLSQDYIVKSPMRAITAPRKERSLPKYMRDDEVRRLLSTARRSDDKDALRNYILIKLYAVTGVRRQEALDLNFEDIDFKKKTIRVRGKGKKERIIPLSEEMDQELWIYFQSRLPLKNPALFITSRGSRVHASRAHEIYKEMLKKAGLDGKGYTLHTLRHSYATNLINNGVDIISVQKLLGHEDIGTTTIYSHVSIDHLKDQVAKLTY